MDDFDPQDAPTPPQRFTMDRLFRVGRKGLWHVQAHQEYGVIFSCCGIRVVAAQTQPATAGVPEKELCGPCVRHAK